MSLRFVLFELSLFESGADADNARTDLGWLLEALTQRDQAYLVDHPRTPRLYESGVIYERPAQFGGECEEVVILRQALGDKAREPRVKKILELVQAVLGGERFRDIGVLYERGSGDCDNVASARSAELRQAGIPASPYMVWRKRLDGGNTYHIQVRWPWSVDGTPEGYIEDPSLLMGMGGPGRAADRQKEIDKNIARAKKLASGEMKLSATSPLNDELQKAFDDISGGGLKNWMGLTNAKYPVTVAGGGHRGWHRDRSVPASAMLSPGIEYEDVNEGWDFPETYDEVILHNTGSMRGGF